MPSERRSAARYPIVLDVRFRAHRKRSNCHGAGRTINISSSGALIESQHSVSAGMRLEIALDWPTLLDGEVALLLVAVGRVAWINPSSFALAFSQYGFRTTKRKFGASSDVASQLAIAATGAS